MAGLVGMGSIAAVAAAELFKPESMGFLTEDGGRGYSRGLGLAALINGIGSTTFMFTLAFGTAKVRKNLIEKSKKNGDEHAEERFKYPKIVAEGFSGEAKQFNCVVRGHQHALEIYPSFLALSGIAACTLPVTTAYCGLLWIVSRYCWAQGYATGEPKNRYKWGFGMGFNVWTSILGLLLAATYSAFTFM